MDNKQVRAKNIAWLVQIHHGPTEFGKLIEREQVQVSQWLGGKPVGDKLARHIEEKLGKKTGWLDQPQWTQLGAGLAGLLLESQRERPDPAKIVVTTRAINRILERRQKGLTLDLTELLDAELFAEAYAECEAMPEPTEADMVAVVADLMLAREAKRGRESEQVGGADRGKDRKTRAG